MKNRYEITGEQCWDIYAEAVGGKTFDGKPLPKFQDLGTQKKGWLAVAEDCNRKIEKLF